MRKLTLLSYDLSIEHIPMTDKHVKIITDNWERLAGDLTTDGVLDKLLAKGIMHSSEHEELLEEKSTRKRVQGLLHLLRKREDKAFYVLIEACSEFNMPHLAKLLKDAGMSCCQSQ